ncbi:hypothetical protein TREMEDRAFT_46125 [Tremella mesenterica DSM 1558]|uniref:uncharacterized protein n=1 Tax=Tremella mesenterica (strain ATCC 24925 / CBS 8224 / DSM 1558 / NBRC 9311 / NRRL Y-6157 / RJB 2259-6 / UBC 559-6) TaxID=578456 RepID=UPI00032C1328|nr:uncharacterized protein TREMEDRAFT_46125 [Tremella mesenterica DSM 1558]EIW65620.1 hypothetical protein TREMEDRAFT_46125 [Tremella mesenterica DSM 1558]
MIDSSSQGSSTQTSTITWINWFTSYPGHEYFCEVHEEFIEDDFNLTGLQSMVPFWKEALEMVIDIEPEEDSSKIPDVSIVESSAELLYGLVHQRFICTKAGLAAMADKYEQGHFGACPRVFCMATHVLPCGRSDMPGVDTVKLFCPNCGDIYTPPSSKYAGVDGAFFGTSFAALFFQTYPEFLSAPFCVPPQPPTTASSYLPNTSSLTSPSPSPSAPSSSKSIRRMNDLISPTGGETYINPDPYGGQKPALGKKYQAKIYGFNVSERAQSGPRMKWLRERPERYLDLDKVDWKGRWKGTNVSQGQDLDMGMGMGMGIKELDENVGKGRLFDDDEEVDDDDDEEEEDEGLGRGVGVRG